MGILKFFMIIIGVGVMAASAMMDTSVSGGRFGERVHNISKAQSQTIFVIIGGVVFLAGVMLRRRETQPTGGARKCPFCAEDIKQDARKCKHCGETVEPVSDANEGASATRRDQRAEEAMRLGVFREEGFWVFDGHRFASVGDAISFASSRQG